MTDRQYKIILSICIVGILAGAIMLGIGLGNKAGIYLAKQRQAATEAKKKQVIENLLNATVKLTVTTPDGKPIYGGTGFVIKTDSEGSWIVTNKHICIGAMIDKSYLGNEEGLQTFRPILAQGRKTPIDFVAINRVSQNQDLCLLRSKRQYKTVLPIAAKISKGEKIYTFGFPLGIPEFNAGKITEIMSGTKLYFYNASDAKVFYGASGSAVINEKGEVVGVVQGIYLSDTRSKDRKNVVKSLIVPLEILREFLEGVR